MEKFDKIIVENGITYGLGEDDIYYLDLQLPEGNNYNIGKFGDMGFEYLKEFKQGDYMEFLLGGKLKRTDQLEWVKRMNNIMACAEKIVTREMVLV